MKKVLLITYYWPPSGGAGVHRWLRMSRYFKENGYELIVYCPKDAAYNVTDKNLLDEIPEEIKIISHKLIEPGNFIQNNPNKGSGITLAKKRSIGTSFIIWVRGNLFIPDARMFWIRPSVRYLSSFLKKNSDIEFVISTGPPHSTHIIAQRLKKRFNLKWVADFRDPWTGIDYYQELHISKIADSIQRKKELSVLQQADKVVTISDNIAKELSVLSSREVDVITNGFIFDFDFESTLKDKFTIAHFGSMPASRNPKVLWKGLELAIKENPEIKEKLSITLYGNVDHSIVESIQAAGLDSYLEMHSSVSHMESILLQRSSQLLLLVVNNSGNVKGTLTGKFFEYLNSKRPILAVGPLDGDLNKALENTQGGVMVDYTEFDKMKSILLTHFEQYKKGQLTSNPINLEEFSTRNLTARFCKLMAD